jgi:hypothetical protein
VAEFASSNQSSNTEVPFPRKWFWVDYEPRLPSSAKDIACMEVLMKEHLFTLGPRQIFERFHSRAQQSFFERFSGPLPVLWELVCPMTRFLAEGRERRTCGLPQPRKEVNRDIQSGVLL